MSDTIISCDAGNGGTTAVLARDKGRYKSIYFPSVRAAATGDSLGLGGDLELDYTYVDWYNHRYVVGEDVLRVTRRHMERDNYENRRRIDPVLVIKEVEDAGFEFVDFSDLHFRADDELRFEVGRRSVTGNTDRFTLLFRKP